MEIITLQQSDYKEKDAIVTAISEDGLISFTVHGLKDPRCKNIILATPLVYADVELSEGKSKYKSVKSSKMLITPYTKENDLKRLATISLLCEASKKMLVEEEKNLIFKYLLNAIEALAKAEIDPIIIALIYLSKLLKMSGYDMEINHCVHCGSKKSIHTFSFFEGGFICEDCFASLENPEIFNINQMKIIRTIFMLEDYRPISFFKEEDGMIILEHLVKFIDDFIGVKLLSFKLF